MLITRRGIFLGASASGFALMLTGRQAPALMFEGVPLGKAPGDEGYKHGLYHDAYQKLAALAHFIEFRGRDSQVHRDV